MAKVVGSVLNCDVNQPGTLGDPNPPSFNMLLRISDTVLRDTEEIFLDRIPYTQLNVPHVSSLIRQHYGLSPLAEVSWPFNGKGDLL